MRNPSQTHALYRADYQAIKALGSPQMASNNQLILDAFPDARLLLQNFTHAIATNTEAVEVNLGAGLQMYTEGVPKTRFQSPITLVETRTGHIQDLADRIMAHGPTDAWAYYGRAETYTKKFRWLGCIISFENGIEAASDGNSQVSVIQGTISYHYFNNIEIGG